MMWFRRVRYCVSYMIGVCTVSSRHVDSLSTLPRRAVLCHLTGGQVRSNPREPSWVVFNRGAGVCAEVRAALTGSASKGRGSTHAGRLKIAGQIARRDTNSPTSQRLSAGQNFRIGSIFTDHNRKKLLPHIIHTGASKLHPCERAPLRARPRGSPCSRRALQGATLKQMLD